jgi:hypothetical protein
MGARFFRPKRLLTLALLAISIAVAVWWLGYIPYDPLAIYRPIPGSATLVGRHLRLPARWNDLLANPLALALMRTAGVRTEDAAGLTADAESRAWFEKLAGREGTLAYLPGRFGGAPAWMAVSHLGGESQKLRWQLSLFRVPGFERMKQFPGRAVWRVDTPDLEPGQNLVIAFGEGVIMACLSESPLAIAEVLAAYDGNVQRLMEESPSFAQFAEGDDRSMADRLWIRDESEFAAPESPGVLVDVPVLRGDAISLSASTKGATLVPEDRASSVKSDALARLLGDAPCAAAMVTREALLHMLAQPWVTRDARHALRMIADVADDRVAVVGMDGDMGGRLAWGAMSSLGLSGLRVPTVLVATPVQDEATATEAIQRVLDTSNAKYRAAFVLQPVSVPPATIYVLESAGGDEWVDSLSRSDRPAYVFLDGWLLASSNLAALQKLVQGSMAGQAGAETPSWAAQTDGASAVSVWLDLARSGKVARDAIATWSMAQVFMNSGNSQVAREQLNEAKAWIDSFAPFGQARAKLGRREGQTVLSVDLGLSGADGSDRIPAP